MPTFICGLVLSNFCFAIVDFLLKYGAHYQIRTGDPVLTKNVLYLAELSGLIALCLAVGGGGRIRTYEALPGARFTVWWYKPLTHPSPPCSLTYFFIAS